MFNDVLKTRASAEFDGVFPVPIWPFFLMINNVINKNMCSYCIRNLDLWSRCINKRVSDISRIIFMQLQTSQ